MGTNTRYVRYHPADDAGGLHELAAVAEPVAVVVRGDGSLDVYGYVGIVDQRGCTGHENRLFPRHTCPCGAVSAGVGEELDESEVLARGYF